MTINTRATWQDWQHELAPTVREPKRRELLTREEVLNRLRAQKVEVAASTLIKWEAAGLLPRPYRRTAKGSSPALYAEWVVWLARWLAEEKVRNRPLDELARRSREVAADFIQRWEARDWPGTEELRSAIWNRAELYTAKRGERPALGLLILLGADGAVLDELAVPVSESAPEAVVHLQGSKR